MPEEAARVNPPPPQPRPSSSTPSAVPVKSSRPSSAPPVVRQGDAAKEYRYWAFISYSSKDKTWGSWLHRAIETYGIPAEFVEHRQTPTGHPAPKRFHPVFRDRDELPASADLGAVIKDALGASHYLIVICSRNSARSHWVNTEIETFISLGRRDHILAIIVDGEPNTGDARECFPPALRTFEPIAADARREGDGKTNAKLKLLAGMLGVNFDSLKQRDRQRQKRRRTLIGVTASVLTALLVTLTGIAVHQSRLAEQRKQTAETASQKISQAKSTSSRRSYMADMLNVQKAWERRDMVRFVELLDGQRPERTGGEDLRGFEWYFWWGRQNQSSVLTLKGHTSVCFSPDGKRVASCGNGGAVKICDSASGQDLLTLKGHSENITSVCFSPDGTRLASAGDTVKVWDAVSGKELVTVEEGNSCVCFSPDGKLLASGGRDKTLKTWDAATGKEILAYAGHNGAVTGLCFSPDGQRLVSTGAEKPYAVKVWNVASGQLLLTLKGGSGCVCYSPDGKQLASGSRNGSITLWNATSGKELTTLRHSASSLCFSPDGERLASGCQDRTVKVYLLKTGEELLTFTAHRSEVKSVCFSPDGTRLASAGDRKDTVKVWDAVRGPVTLKGLGIKSICFSRDSKRLAATGYETKLWDAESGQELLKLGGEGVSVSLSPDGKRLASSIGYTVKVWDAVSGKELHTLIGHNCPVDSVCFSPDGTRLASAGSGTRVWDVASGREIITFKGNDVSVCFSPDGRYLASGDASGRVKMRNADNGKELLAIEAHRSHVCCVCFSPDGKRLATAGDDKLAKLWDVTTGQELFTLKGHNGAINSICFSPDGSRLASGSSDRSLKLWDVESGQELLALADSDGEITGVCFSTSGTRLASSSGGKITIWDVASGHRSGEQDQVDSSVKVWDTATGKKLLTPPGHQWDITTSVCYSPEGERLATAGYEVKVCNADNGQGTLLLKGHQSKVECICFSPDGKMIATGSADKTVKLWDAISGKELRTLNSRMQIQGVYFSPDGKCLASAGNGVTVWDATNREELFSVNELVDSASFSPDGKRLVLGGDREEVGGIWDVVTGKKLMDVRGAHNVCFSPDGKRIASGGHDNVVRVWDAENGKVLLVLKGQGHQVCFSPDSKRLASCGADGIVKICDSVSGQELLTFKAHSGQVISICFSPDGKRLVSGGSRKL